MRAKKTIVKEVRKATRIEPFIEDKNTKSRSDLHRQKWCVICGQKETQIAYFHVEGATLIERYCDNCVESVYPREAVL